MHVQMREPDEQPNRDDDAPVTDPVLDTATYLWEWPSVRGQVGDPVSLWPPSPFPFGPDSGQPGAAE
jgi:hypothetical protein